MKKLVSIKFNPEKSQYYYQRINQSIESKLWIELIHYKNKQTTINKGILPEGPGFLVSSGGSSNGPYKCLLPCSHLNQSALATGLWLESQGIKKKNCLILNPLPFHHVSGLMPWWRSRCWESKHEILPSEVMRDPSKLERKLTELKNEYNLNLICSLVPTQLKRLIDHPAGIRALQLMDLIWVGGSSLSSQLSSRARGHNIRLSPCYGATETGSMITAQKPNDFLAGEENSGSTLDEVHLKVNNDNTLFVKTLRLAIARCKNNVLEKITDQNGWWETGDKASLSSKENVTVLTIYGRKDNAILSGGETVYIDNIHSRLNQIIEANHLPIELFFITSIHNDEWGERLVGLIKTKKSFTSFSSYKIILILESHIKDWPTSERPINWYHCPELETNSLGKWEFQRWKNWIRDQQPII